MNKFLFVLSLILLVGSSVLFWTQKNTYSQVNRQMLDLREKQNSQLEFNADLEAVQAKVKSFGEWYHTYAANMPQGEDLGWLRESVEHSELQFQNYERIQSHKVKLRVSGSEADFWNWVADINKEYPWLNLSSVEILMHRKHLSIRNVALLWSSPKTMEVKASSKRSSDIQTIKKWQAPKQIDPSGIKLFSSKSSGNSKNVSTSKKFSTPLPPFKVSGGLGSRGITFSESNQNIYWGVGEARGEWTLQSVHPRKVIFKHQSGSFHELELR